jgi:phage gpG-like protein
VTDFSLVGNIGAVDMIAAGIAELGENQFKRAMLEEMADEALFLIDREFRGAADPDGTPWAHRKRDYPWPILDKTGALRSSFRKRLNAEGFAIYTLKKYAPFHQHGTSKMVARPFFPVGAPPAQWLRHFDEIAERHVRRVLPTGL